MTNPTYAQAVKAANNLIEVGEPNPEYERALVELLYDLYDIDCPTGLAREHIATDLGLDLEVLYPTPEPAVELRKEMLAANGDDVYGAAAQLARQLATDDPATLKVGYSHENAILAAVEVFPEVTGGSIRLLNGWDESG